MEVKQKEFNDRELECRNEVMDYSTEKNKRLTILYCIFIVEIRKDNLSMRQ